VILITLILAGILLLTESRITAFNNNVRWNGYGSMLYVLRGEAQAPMQYRVLIPWLWKLFGKRGKPAYNFIKGIGLWLALYGFAMFCEVAGVEPLVGVLFLAAVIPATFLFDYADCYYEFGFLAIAYTLSIGYVADFNLVWLIVLTFLATINRETGVFIPIGYLILNGGIVGTIALGATWLVSYIIPRLYYGRKGRYCGAVMFKENWKFLSKHFSVYHIVYFGLMLWVIGSMVFYPLWYGPALMTILFLVVLHIPSLWHETRVFTPALLYAIPVTIKGLM